MWNVLVQFDTDPIDLWPKTGCKYRICSHMCTSFNNSSTIFNKQFIANSQIGQVKDSRILTVWTTERDVLVDGMNSGTNAHVLYCQRIQPTESWRIYYWQGISLSLVCEVMWSLCSLNKGPFSESIECIEWFQQFEFFPHGSIREAPCLSRVKLQSNQRWLEGGLIVEPDTGL